MRLSGKLKSPQLPIDNILKIKKQKFQLLKRKKFNII